PDDTVPRFDYEAHMGALTGQPPRWPDSTRAVSELRVSLRVKPNGLLAGLQGPRTVHLDIIDYPGEWLLDLALMDQSYDDWSAATLARLATRDAGAAYCTAEATTDGAAKLDEVQAKSLAAAFTEYLHAARAAGFYDCTPGRFLLPGDLDGSPVLTFAPLSPGDAPRRSLRREMARRYEAYKSQVVRPFFRDHFSRIDRQVVLVDALGAIHSGPAAVEDMRAAMADILGAFKPGRNAFLTRLFRGKRVERILFAATKADHLHHSQHPRLTAIMEALTRGARDRARFAGAETQALSLAALRATTEETMTHDGEPLDVVRGTLLDTGKQAAFYPGALPEDPSHILSPAKDGAAAWLDEDYQIMRFAPAPLNLRPGDGPPHMRMDRAAQFLIGDKL
ncbi:MAG: YcjX family protein, partial [Tateyamaria sp.]